MWLVLQPQMDTCKINREGGLLTSTSPHEKNKLWNNYTTFNFHIVSNNPWVIRSLLITKVNSWEYNCFLQWQINKSNLSGIFSVWFSHSAPTHSSQFQTYTKFAMFFLKGSAPINCTCSIKILTYKQNGQFLPCQKCTSNFKVLI